jgi:hypothetical protein
LITIRNDYFQRLKFFFFFFPPDIYLQDQKGEKRKDGGEKNNNTCQDVFKNGRRKAASVTINEKINEDKIQYITIY